MLSNKTTIAQIPRSTGKLYLHRLVITGLTTLAVLAMLLTDSPGTSVLAAHPQTPSSQSQSPEATCPPDGQCFADVPSTNPFYAFVNQIYKQELVSGYACGGGR